MTPFYAIRAIALAILACLALTYLIGTIVNGL